MPRQSEAHQRVEDVVGRVEGEAVHAKSNHISPRNSCGPDDDVSLENHRKRGSKGRKDRRDEEGRVGLMRRRELRVELVEHESVQKPRVRPKKG
jgi:hypothetical protein